MQADQLEDAARNLGLLFLRLSGAAFLFYIHGLPKWLHYSAEVQHIEDPFHLGASLTLGLAIFAEVLCPVLIALGVLTRLACLPILTVLIIALAVVHPDWTLEQGQFGWLLLIIFTALLVGGPGRFSFSHRLPGVLRHA